MLVISYRAPQLCQGRDEEVLSRIAEVIFPGTLKGWPRENGFWLWVEGEETNEATAEAAVAKFQTLLGVLRAWRAEAGELQQEWLSGRGQEARDAEGNQWVRVGRVISYGIVGPELEVFADKARQWIEASEAIRNALWLNGRANRTAADYYMIHEYSQVEFGGTNGVRTALGISTKAQSRLTQSANQLSPLKGGRHVKGGRLAPMTLEQQREFVADPLRRWIKHPLPERSNKTTEFEVL